LNPTIVNQIEILQDKTTMSSKQLLIVRRTAIIKNEKIQTTLNQYGTTVETDILKHRTNHKITQHRYLTHDF